MNNSGLNSGLISGSFSVSGADDDSYTLYFQLNSNAMYAVSASDGMLTVTLRPLVAPETSKQTSDDNSDNPVIDVSAAEKPPTGKRTTLLQMHLICIEAAYWSAVTI